jgi:hypothetical protein
MAGIVILVWAIGVAIMPVKYSGPRRERRRPAMRLP